MTDTAVEEQSSILNEAVAQGGAYDLIRKRLLEQGQSLDAKVSALNEQREAEFGRSGLEVIGRTRVRTENNCVPRDIARVGKYLLFGYNVFIGLKKETHVHDVFSLYELSQEQEAYEINAVESQSTFLQEPAFVKAFQELYSYYKDAHLLQLQVVNQRLLASFQIGNKIEDVKVFRWSVSLDGEVKYIDDRGERDIIHAPSHDFEWLLATREDHVLGKHPHVSIYEEVFVETINGDLTIKVENNTESGLGVYSEPVDDAHQSLSDAQVYYAKVGTLILLKILPYREQNWRYLVFNTLTKQALRIDAVGQACIQLPEDHGIIFPGGYYLQNGQNKTFDDDITGLRFVRSIRSPNGEDVLYVFYEEVEGRLALFAYNLIRKELQKPIYAHGYTLYDDGKALVFKSESSEASRVHPMQIWQTPFCTDEYASAAAVKQTFLGKIGNSELVRGISELYSVVRAVNAQKVSAALYESLIATCQRILDSYYWLNAAEIGSLDVAVKSIAETAELVLDEFEKVSAIQKQTAEALSEAEIAQSKLLKEVHIENWNSAEQFVKALTGLRKQRGHLLSLKELRYIDLSRLDALDKELEKEQNNVGRKTAQFLIKESALANYHNKIAELQTQIAQVTTVADLRPLIESSEQMAQGLDTLTEVLAALKIDDATQRTRILESISQVYAKLNQVKAQAGHRRKELGSGEAIAEFGAQFTLFSQSITGALSIADTPDKCDEQLSRLLIQLEELESRFSEYDEFLPDIIAKREELYETFESRKQALMDERQRRAQNLANAADRILSGIQRRSQNFNEQDELNTYFSTDSMVLKIRELAGQLRELDESVRADDIEARLKANKEQAIRSLRDKRDIFEQGGNVIKFGKHRFSVNTQPLDMTVVVKKDQQTLHLTGTDYYQALDNAQLNELKAYWNQSLVSETEQIYRSEYLAAQLINAAQNNLQGLSMETLQSSVVDAAQLKKLIRDFASPRYQEGYEKGIHDEDCAAILTAVLPVLDEAGLLAYGPKCRALAALFWMNYSQDKLRQSWLARAHSAQRLSTSLASNSAIEVLKQEILKAISQFLQNQPLPFNPIDAEFAAEYLAKQLAVEPVAFVTSRYGDDLAQGLLDHLETIGHRRQYLDAMENLTGSPCEQWLLTEAWLNGFVKFHQRTSEQRFIPEAAAMLIGGNTINRSVSALDLQVTIANLMGDHPKIQHRSLTLFVDEFLERLNEYMAEGAKHYQAFQKVRQQVVEQERQTLRLQEFKPRPLTSFVRNKLINEAYLPIIGDNLAKQMGTVGDSKRTDLMGLLLLISPPGYGKTTLMEYVANRLGLVFMKINCPSLGHDVRSVDPGNAPNATAKQELEKLNLALEMGNNVMLYLDDIQHTHPEFLQKFISLCDATRRMEGVWRGKTKTYDLRGKKFCVVMAGNPYTESGEVFKIPDMLANRADVYNLGDILSGQDDIFALSYIENALTSNPVLAPLALRDMEDVYKLIRMAKGESVPTTDLGYSYSAAEVNEITNVLKKLFKIQDVILKVNQAYIASAASSDKYRVEPPFKLQGSYRNMNKMAEKVVAIMEDKELQELIGDHYAGEAQLLTTGAEENLLKLAQLRGVLTETQKQRWASICNDYRRLKSLGGDDMDAATKVVNQMALISERLQNIGHSLQKEPDFSKPFAVLAKQIADIKDAVAKTRLDIKVVNEPLPGLEIAFAKLADTIDQTFIPVVQSMNHKINLDLNVLKKVTQLSADLRQFTNSKANEKTKRVKVSGHDADPPADNE